VSCTGFGGFEVADPFGYQPLRANGAAEWPGWPSSPRLEALRDACSPNRTLRNNGVLLASCSRRRWTSCPLSPWRLLVRDRASPRSDEPSGGFSHILETCGGLHSGNDLANEPGTKYQEPGHAAMDDLDPEKVSPWNGRTAGGETCPILGRKHGAEFKAKVALAAVWRGEKMSGRGVVACAGSPSHDTALIKTCGPTAPASLPPRSPRRRAPERDQLPCKDSSVQ
jgi:hypothetical protein